MRFHVLNPHVQATDVADETVGRKWTRTIVKKRTTAADEMNGSNDLLADIMVMSLQMFGPFAQHERDLMRSIHHVHLNDK